MGDTTAPTADPSPGDDPDVVVVGGGVAGLSAATFLARAGLATVVVEAGGSSPDGGEGSLLRRNAHVENYPGFPAGVNPRLLLEMIRDGADRAGATVVAGTVTRVARATGGEGGADDPAPDATGGFVVETAADRYRARWVVAATKNEVGYLADGVELLDRGKQFVAVDDRGRTGVPGLYAAGRIAGKPHQAIVAAGHGAEVAVALLEDADRPFYHDWVTPAGYFTDRGREVPPGCAEVSEAERRERERESRETMRAYLADPHPDEQVTHPSLEDE